MAKYSDQVRASDVTFFAFVALLCCAVAVLGANLMSFVPAGLLGGLHASRLDGGTVSQLQVDVASLEAETVRLKQENDTLRQRFTLAEGSTTAVSRRIGTLEGLLPKALEASARDELDMNAVTATTTGSSETFDVDGGSVRVTTSPLVRGSAPASTDLQPMPQALVPVAPSMTSFGIALGAPLNAEDAPAAWSNLNAKVGTLLLGLGPLLANVEGGPGKRLVAGPIPTEAEARQLCGLMGKVGIACASVPFMGDPL